MRRHTHLPLLPSAAESTPLKPARASALGSQQSPRSDPLAHLQTSLACLDGHMSLTPSPIGTKVCTCMHTRCHATRPKLDSGAELVE